MNPRVSLVLRVDFNVPVLCDLRVELRDPATGEVIVLNAPVYIDHIEREEENQFTGGYRTFGSPSAADRSTIVTYEGIYTREEGFHADSAQPEKLQRVLDLRKTGA